MSKTPRTPSGYEIAANLAEEVDQLRAELTAAKEKIAELERNAFLTRAFDCQQLEAQIKALREDAERYRWLRNNCQYGFEDHDGPQLVHRNGETGACQNANWREDLDAAIDAALKK